MSSSENQDSGVESDKELQLAWEKGLLKSGGLNYAVTQKRQPINNVNGLKSKLGELKKDLPWIERLDVSIAQSSSKSEENDKIDQDQDSLVAKNAASTSKKSEEDDFARELEFYREAQAAISKAIPKLRKLGVPTARPNDYLAEMVKSDTHMKKVRENLLRLQLSKKKQEDVRRLRQEKKFASKVQTEVLQARQAEKRKLLDAVKKHRKGVKDQLQDVLDNRKGSGAQAENAGPTKTKAKGRSDTVSKKRAYKDTKFGFGGQKKRGKYNTKESAQDVSMFSSKVHSKAGAKGGKKGGKGGKKRLGKGRRQKMKGRH